ncbi:hypothetical protein BGZ63DRAFT_408421 [Mariannaea sp. PMI_226]|nr:hypothetical protein BGZ63DRAFT_408421 [Mariannaea sp. PMI_226]
MGGWDIYCAICGGPLKPVSDDISRKQRTARFRRLHRNGGVEGDDVESQPEEDNEAQQNEDGDDGDDGSIMSEDEESLATSEEEVSYDPDVISPADVEWVESVHVLGCNPEAASTSKAFISGPCGPGGFDGTVEIAPGDDRFCYFVDDSEYPIFPFHWCCFELLSKALTGKTDPDLIDKDILYKVWLGLGSNDKCRLPTIDYGDPGPDGSQYWLAEAGKEFFVVDPMKTPHGLTDLIASTIEGSAFNDPPPHPDLAPRVQHDPFLKLPADLIDSIAFLLPTKDLFNLLNASWVAFSTLSNNTGFWMRCIRGHMPWFFEAHDFLDKSDKLNGKSRKMIYRWLDQVTYPRRHISGPFMSIANRRRVWHVCEQLAEKYLPMLRQKGPNEGLDAAEKLIRSQSISSKISCIYTQTSTNWGPNWEIVSSFWVKSWDTIFLEESTIETFWDSSGSLVGLGVSSAGSCRLLGIDDTNDGVVRQKDPVPKYDWITGIILHVSSSDIKGITVSSKCHGDVHIRETRHGHPQRAFLARGNDRYIVGVVGQVGPIEGRHIIQKFGVLHASRRSPDEQDIPPQNPLESCLWKEPYHQDLGTPIWEHPGLRLISNRVIDIETSNASQEALIWAKNEFDLRLLARITASITVGHGKMFTVKWETRDTYVVHGLKAESRTEYGNIYRSVGEPEAQYDVDLPMESRQHFEIDGQGGERITAISFATEMTQAIKLRTNKDREVLFGDSGAFNWRIIRPEEGETLVGLVIAFQGDGELDESTQTYKRKKILSVAGLGMRLETNEFSPVELDN